MADTNIQKEFIDGLYEVYSVMFTDGVNDGVYYYPLHTPENVGVYKEEKYKKYLPPVLLVAKVQLVPEQGEEDIKAIKERATITIPYKSLMNKEIDVSNKNLPELRKGMIKFKDTFYSIDNIKPSVFVENTFLAYIFECTEELSTKDLTLYVAP